MRRAHAIGEPPPDDPPISDEGALAVTEPVVMEVLAGARTDQREWDLRRLLLRFDLLRFDPASDFDGAVRVYRRCREAGAPRAE